MLVNLKDVLTEAQKGKYAVGLFNTVTLEMARGVIMAAEEARSPVIIGTAEVLLPFAPLEELSYLLVPMAKKASVPVVLNFDHGITPELIIKSLSLGFTSVMYDCSTDSYEDNRFKCREMAKTVHMFGASIETELGHVGANEGGSAEGDDTSFMYTDPSQAREFANFTGTDALAVAVGTAHGAYKSKPKLDFERLEAIAGLVSAPLVLHGGSGLSDDDFKTSIQKGISKVNIFTDVNVSSAHAAHELLSGSESGMTDALPGIVEAVKNVTLRKIEIFGSCNKA